MNKRIAGFVNAISVAGVALVLVVASASAATVTFNTNSVDTKFAGNGLSLASSGGAAASLVFNARPDSVTGTPSNVSFGYFTLFCPSCTTQANAGGAFFGGFTFNLIITDISDGGSGQFVGTSSGGTVFSDVSPMTISWVPLVLGPGTLNAASGTFGPSTFRILGPTSIVAPNSGTNPGQTTVEGAVTSTLDSSVPEPGTMALFGAGLIGLRLLIRKK
ncbi:MAG: PEP-CTERM sorting domain-containing protein [Acidobacteria bacterium]|nr:PEP-CTERM sorting domain-containing protein [Acidobacteriota bacterium]